MKNSDSDIILEVKDLCKKFKIPKKEQKVGFIKKFFKIFYREWTEIDIIKNLNFKVYRGEIIGYLGKNGAGKSTSIKMFTSILYPSSGEIIAFKNINPIRDRIEYTSQIGVVFGQRTMLEYHIPVKYSFKIFKSIYNLEDKFFEERLKYFVKILNLEEIIERPYRMLSLGEKMRCELAIAFIHKPKLVFLDEPTIGLDVHAKLIIREFLKNINKEEKVTIILTTHDMGDIEELCKRIILIDDGKIKYDGKLSIFKKRYGNWKRLTIEYNKILDRKKLKDILKNKKIIKNENNFLEIKISGDEKVGQILTKIISCLEVIDLKIKGPKLENILSKLYQNDD